MQELPPLPDGFVVMQGAGDTMPTQQAPTTSAPRAIPGTGPKPAAPPAGYRWDDGGGLAPIPGGPADKPESGNAPPSGYRWTAGGGLEPIPGGPAADGGSGGKPDTKEAQKGANLDSLVDQINRVQTLFNDGQRDNAIPLLGSLWEYLPTQENTAFDSASAGLAEQGLAAFRVPGVGSQSDTELKQFVEANRPSSWSNDSSNEERLWTLRNRVDKTRASMGLPPADWKGVNGLTGSVTYEGPNPANEGGGWGKAEVVE